MKKQIFTLALFSALASPGASLAGNIYVSPNGDDAAKGTVSEPLKTVEAALKQAREWRRLGSAEAEGGINIIMSGGDTASVVDTAEKLLPFTFIL